MSIPRITLTLTLLLAIWAFTSSASGAHHATPAPAVDCSSVILNLADCLSVVTTGSTEKEEKNKRRQRFRFGEFNNLKVSDFGLSALLEQLNNGLLHTACKTLASCKQDSDLANYKQDSTMNTFDIFPCHICVGFIRTFRGGLGKKEQRFTAAATVELIEEMVSEIGAKLGYKVEKNKSGILGLMKEKIVLLAKILEVTPELWWVELKLVACGKETQGVKWGELKLGLEDIVLSWYEEVC
ncbi:hypothetical protein LguiB_023720 [Lonicera macranthoides]